MPSTWNAYSTEVLGYVAPQTSENEQFVVENKIAAWLSEGKTAEDIFLIWNQGHDGPCIKGVNKFGVPYNSCAYAAKGLALLETTKAPI